MSQHVLVVEDEPDSSALVSALLQVKLPGVDVDCVDNGEAALALVKEKRPDLVVIDLALPGMDGWAVYGRLGEDPKTANIPAIIVSAFVSPAVEAKAEAKGFAACYSKPFDPEQFVASVSQHLKRKPARV